MTATQTRREYLLAAGGAALYVTSTPARSSSAAGEMIACAQGDTLEAELADRRSRLRDLEASLKADEDAVADLESRLVELKRSNAGESPFSTSTLDRAREVGAAARQSVAYLYLEDELGSGFATGWFVDDGLLLTNSHNVEGATGGHAWSFDGERFDFEVVERVESQSPDVALLRTDHEAPALPVDDEAAVEEGLSLVQVGFPGGFGNWVVSLGSVLRPEETSIASTVPGLTGNSGSPVLSLEGDVVAMTYGGEPTGAIALSGIPEPVPLEVRTMPLSPKEDSLHLPIGLAMEKLEEWT